MTRLFVYGTLRKPGRNHHYLKTADFITKAQVKGCLYWIQGLNYPALLEGEEWISGELYEVDAPTEVRLDELEGYIAIDHPDNLYHKKQMDIVDERFESLGKAFVYIFNADAPQARHLVYKRIDENDYFPQ